MTNIFPYQVDAITPSKMVQSPLFVQNGSMMQVTLIPKEKNVVTEIPVKNDAVPQIRIPFEKTTLVGERQYFWGGFE